MLRDCSFFFVEQGYTQEIDRTCCERISHTEKERKWKATMEQEHISYIITHIFTSHHTSRVRIKN